MTTKSQTSLKSALRKNRVVVLAGPLGSDFEDLAWKSAQAVWSNPRRAEAVRIPALKGEIHGVVLHGAERLLGAQDRTAFFALMESEHRLLLTCDRDWLEDVQRSLLGEVAVVALPEVVELPYVRDLSARLCDTLPLSARGFRERLHLQLPALGEALAHPLIVKWSLMDWLDERYRTHSRSIRQSTAELSLTFHLRRALRAWIQEMALTDLEESSRVFLACLRDERIRPQ